MGRKDWTRHRKPGFKVRFDEAQSVGNAKVPGSVVKVERWERRMPEPWESMVSIKSLWDEV